MFTSREVYALGYAFGRLSDALTAKGKNPPDTKLAVMRPLTGFGDAHQRAVLNRAITEDVERDLMEALSWVNYVPDEAQEPVIPMELQGSWWQGYYRAKGGQPLSPDAPEDD